MLNSEHDLPSISNTSSITFLKWLTRSTKMGSIKAQNDSEENIYLSLESISDATEIPLKGEISFSPITVTRGDHDSLDVLALWVHSDSADRIGEFPLDPSCVANSGSGIDLYWKLRKDQAGQFPSIGEAKPYLEKITEWFGGEGSIGQLLRLPEEFNLSDWEYRLEDFDFLFSLQSEGESLENGGVDTRNDNPVEKIEAQEELDERKLEVNSIEKPSPLSPKNEVTDTLIVNSLVSIKEDNPETPEIELDGISEGANPQAEDGHVDIANEITEALAKINLSPYESRILWAIWRKTWGWHKKIDRISYSQFEKITGLYRWSIQRTLQRLEKRRIIILSKEYGKILTYGFQKDYTKWKKILSKEYEPLKKLNTNSTKTKKSYPPKSTEHESYSPEATDRTLRSLPQKKITKETNIGRSKKETDPRVKEFFNYWRETFQKETGQPYVFSFGKEGSQVKALLQIHPPETLEDIVRLFFGDEQCKRRGLTIGIFYQEINRLIGLKAMNPLEQIKRKRIRGEGYDEERI